MDPIPLSRPACLASAGYVQVGHSEEGGSPFSVEKGKGKVGKICVRGDWEESGANIGM